MGLIPPFTPTGRLIAELRLLRRAAERIADVLELQAQHSPRTGQTFRGFSHDAPGSPDHSGVSYANDDQLGKTIQAELSLRALLGREPSDEELARELRGDVE